ncbi:hypothetical protein D1815_12930 [Aquimarina sp. AD1]|uniref:hypothetical protein n=1 Tax=Aquimarina TaxID=290174 RepID=UPI00048675F5|nr:MULTISPECIES: hypothetical protein [Aquimarina]AXT56622.1 hypothetical protein D1815_12930 [Aquimarina sp. AD1]RKN14406.1 hypothetical protein D7035_16870 [Aquimarina sp. AD1]
MKSYDNKKFYNYKTSHKRKKRTKSAKIWWKSNSWEYRRYLRGKYRNQCKTILRRKVEGENIEFPLYKKTLWWEA